MAFQSGGVGVLQDSADQLGAGAFEFEVGVGGEDEEDSFG